MSGYLLDTNCISELVRIQPEPVVVAWMEAADETLLYLSVLTLGEIRKGLAGPPRSKRRTRLEISLETELCVRFAGRILPIDGQLQIGGAHSLPVRKAKGRLLQPLVYWQRQRFTTI